MFSLYRPLPPLTAWKVCVVGLGGTTNQNNPSVEWFSWSLSLASQSANTSDDGVVLGYPTSELSPIDDFGHWLVI